MTDTEAPRLPLPTFDIETATHKVRLAEDAENCEFGARGHMRRCIDSIGDLPIAESERRFHWPQGRRPDDAAGPSELGP